MSSSHRFVLVAVIAGCGGAAARPAAEYGDLDGLQLGEEDAARVPRGAAEPAAVAWTAAAPRVDVLSSVEVIDVGREPRALLAHRVEVGHREAADVLESAGIEVNGDRGNLSTVMVGWTVEVVAVADGAITLRGVIDRAGARPEPDPIEAHVLIDDEMRSMRGTRFTGVVSTSGRWLSFARDNAHAGPGQMQPADVAADGALNEGRRAVVVLPEVAIGPRARWRVRWRQVLDEVVYDTVHEYVLESRDGDRAVLSAAMVEHQQPRPESPEAALVPTAAGHGVVRIDFDATRLTAVVSGELDLTLRLGKFDGTGARRWSITPRTAR